MERCLTEPYLARKGYVPGSEQQSPEPDAIPNPNIKVANTEEVQANIPNQLKAQYAAQQQAPSTISSTPTTQTRRPNLRKEPPSPSTRSDTPPPPSTPGTEPSYQPLEPGRDSKSRTPFPPPPLSTAAEIPGGLYSELQRRQNICLAIERQIEACQKEIRTYPSKQRKIEKQHEKRMTDFAQPVQDAKQDSADIVPQTAEEVEREEMRDIYLQYDRRLSGVPSAATVDALFVVIADTENHFKKDEEVSKAAKKRGAKLEGKLYEARCAVLEVEDEVEEVENGGLGKDGEWKVGKDRIEGREEGVRKSRRRRGGKDGRNGGGDGGDERVGRRRKRWSNLSSKTGKTSSDTALDG